MQSLLPKLVLPVMFLVAVGYVALNVLVIRNCRRWWRAVVTPLRRTWRVQMHAVHLPHLRVLMLWQVGGVVALGIMIGSPMAWLMAASVLLGFNLLVFAIIASFIARLPFVVQASGDISFKIALGAVPAFVAYIAHGFAGAWLSNLLGFSAANAGGALIAATVLLMCLAAVAVMGVLALVFEVALIVSLPRPMQGGGRAKWMQMAAFFLISFFAAFLAARAAALLPGSRLGGVLLSAVVFEFDAVSPAQCRLTPAERARSQGREPTLKVLHLASSQERGILLERSPLLLAPMVLRGFTKADADARTVRVGRVVDCFQV